MLSGIDCSHWRAHLLSNAVNYHHQNDPTLFPHTAKMIYLPTAMEWHHPKVQEVLGMGDVLIFQRNIITDDVWGSMDYWRALGKIVLVDIDDHYPNLPPSNPAHSFWIKNIHDFDPDPIELMKTGMMHSDGLVAPSKILLKDWEKIVPGYYWPNYPSIKDYKDLEMKPLGAPDVMYKYESPEKEGEKPKLGWYAREKSEGQIVIGWGGSISHVDSFVYSGILPALKRLMEEDERVVFKFCGNEGRLDTWLMELPEKQMVKQQSVSPSDWPRIVATFDIGVAPLDMRPVESKLGNEHGEYSYDERRSWLKAVEYACAGVPFVATKSATYEDVGHLGKLVETGEQYWYEALKTRVDSIAHFKKEAQDRRDWALKKYTIENNTGRLIDFYRKVILDAQIRRGARLPDVIYL